MKAQERKKIRYTKAAKSIKTKKNGVRLVSEALVKKGRRNIQAKMNVNRGDEIVVISGDDKGKIAKVLEVFRDNGKILVEGVNVIKKHRRAAGPGQEGEIIEMEAPIFASKVMLWDEANKKPSRVGHKVLDNGKKVRTLKSSGEQIV